MTEIWTIEGDQKDVLLLKSFDLINYLFSGCGLELEKLLCVGEWHDLVVVIPVCHRKICG